MDKKILQIIQGQSLTSVRLIAALFIVNALMIQIIFGELAPDFKNPLPEVFFLVALVAGLFFITFFLKKSAALIAHISLVSYCMVLTYGMRLIILNDFHLLSVILFLLILGSGTVVINNLSFYAIKCLLIIAILFAFYVAKPQVNEAKLLSFYVIGTGMGVYGTILFMRLKLRSRIAFDEYVLSSLNTIIIVSSPDGHIKHVDSSIKDLLSYDPKSLLGNGWWNNESLSNAWIPRDYILNYPQIISNEFKSMESLAIGSNGKAFWIKWMNLVLGNGDYLGIGVNVTSTRSI